MSARVNFGRISVGVPNGDDLNSVYVWANDPRVAHHWRNIGVQVSPEAFKESLSSSLSAHFVGRERATSTSVAYSCLYSVNLRAGHGQLGILSSPYVLGSGLGIELGAYTVLHAFRTYPLRKIYLEMPAYNVATVGRVLDLYANLEATLPDHVYWDGELHATLIYSISRSVWFGSARRYWQWLIESH